MIVIAIELALLAGVLLVIKHHEVVFEAVWSIGEKLCEHFRREDTDPEPIDYEAYQALLDATGFDFVDLVGRTAIPTNAAFNAVDCDGVTVLVPRQLGA